MGVSHGVSLVFHGPPYGFPWGVYGGHCVGCGPLVFLFGFPWGQWGSHGVSALFHAIFLGGLLPHQTTSFHDYICIYITHTQIHLTKNNNNKIVKPNNTKKNKQQLINRLKNKYTNKTKTNKHKTEQKQKKHANKNNKNTNTQANTHNK